MLSRGVEEPLLDAEGSSLGVAVPDRAGVPITGRRLEMIPVFVFWKVTAGVEDSASSYRRMVSGVNGTWPGERTESLS